MVYIFFVFSLCDIKKKTCTKKIRGMEILIKVSFTQKHIIVNGMHTLHSDELLKKLLDTRPYHVSEKT